MRLKISRLYRDPFASPHLAREPLGNRSNSVHVCMQSLEGSFFIGIEMVAERFKADPANDGLTVYLYRKLNRLKRFIGSEVHGSSRFSNSTVWPKEAA